MQGLLEHFRNILAVKISNDNSFLVTSKMLQEKYMDHSKHFETNDILRIIQIISNSEQQLKYSPQQKIRFELILSQLATLPKSLDIKSLIDLIQNSPVPSSTLPVTSTIQSKEEPKSTPNTNLIVEKQNQQSINLKQNTEKQSEVIKKSKDLTKSDIQSKWDDFISFASENAIFFNSLKTIIVEFSESQITLIFDSLVMYKNYISEVNKKKLSDLLYQFYNSQVRVTYKNEADNNKTITNYSNIEEIKKEEKNEKEANVNSSENLNTTNTNQTSSNKKNENLNEVEKSLIKIFNATLLK
jgi:DNA polymerase-3 subunit gamma/tau